MTASEITLHQRPQHIQVNNYRERYGLQKLEKKHMPPSKL